MANTGKQWQTLNTIKHYYINQFGISQFQNQLNALPPHYIKELYL